MKTDDKVLMGFVTAMIVAATWLLSLVTYCALSGACH